MITDDHWFTEYCEEAGSAHSFRIKARIHEEQTRYQKIEIYETTHFGKLMVIDGFIMLSARDNFIYHEMLAHPILYIHDAPRRVAIVGGGDCGTLNEVLKHPEVEQVTLIDIDERVVQLSEVHFPELCGRNGDSRAEFCFTDGYRWMAEAPGESLDIIIVDSTDPIGPGEILFSGEFYGACEKTLKNGGMMIQQSESPLLHMDILQGMYRQMKGAGFSHRKSLFFPLSVYPSGWWSATLARKGEPVGGFREEDAKNRPFRTRYYNVDIHRSSFCAPEFFFRELGDAGPPAFTKGFTG